MNIISYVVESIHFTFQFSTFIFYTVYDLTNHLKPKDVQFTVTEKEKQLLTTEKLKQGDVC